MSNPIIRVLWTSNIDLPEVASELGLKTTPFGGWLSTTTKNLSTFSEFKVGVAMRSNSTAFKVIEKDGIVYFALPQIKGSFDVSQSDVEKVIAEFRPDILHVEGAELPHALRFLKTWEGSRLLSMQGVLNGIKRYQLGGLPIARMLVPIRPHLSLVAIAILVNYWRNFCPRLTKEREAMSLTDHVMGRTLWDQAQAAVLAPSAQYHACPRILRAPFYNKVWTLNNKEDFTVFLGNAATPLKGAHIAVEALAILVRKFPNMRLYIAGEDPKDIGLYSLKRYVGYPSYLLYLIRKYGLEKNIHYTGMLSADQMAERMVASHVCLTASIIENSPNTLGEAMLLGVPVVSAYSGGAPSMASDETEVLFYRAEDPIMLAHQIGRVFENPELAQRLSENGRKRALESHDPQRNMNMLINTYKAILADQ